MSEVQTQPQADKKELAPRADMTIGRRGLQLKSVAELGRLAAAMVEGGMVPKGLTPKTATCVMLRGMEMGFGPIESLSVIGAINGRYFLYGDGITALLHRSRLLEDQKIEITGEGENLEAVVRLKRRGTPSWFEGRFSWKDAMRASLAGKDTYKAYPKRMLFRRAMWIAAHDGFSDVLSGLWGQEEVEDMEFTMPTPVVVENPNPQAAQIESAPETIELPKAVKATEAVSIPLSDLDKVAVVSDEQAQMWEDWCALKSKLGPDDIASVRATAGVGKIIPSLTVEKLAKVITAAEAIIADEGRGA